MSTEIRNTSDFKLTKDFTFMAELVYAYFWKKWSILYSGCHKSSNKWYYVQFNAYDENMWQPFCICGTKIYFDLGDLLQYGDYFGILSSELI